MIDVKNIGCIVPKFSDRQVWANSADPVQTAPDQGLHCLLFLLHLLDTFLKGKATLFKFYGDYNNIFGVGIFRIFTVLQSSPFYNAMFGIHANRLRYKLTVLYRDGFTETVYRKK